MIVHDSLAPEGVMATIVLVDDDDGLRQALAIRLRASGFQVFAADGPETAMRLVLRHKPDVLVLDIEMPGYTGLEFHECLQLSDRARSVSVLYLTGSDSESYRLRAANQ